MSLGRGPEVLLRPEVNLYRIVFEPATAARGEFRRFGSFGKLQHVAIELARATFPAPRHRELHMIYSDYGHAASLLQLDIAISDPYWADVTQVRGAGQEREPL